MSTGAFKGRSSDPSVLARDFFMALTPKGRRPHAPVTCAPSRVGCHRRHAVVLPAHKFMGKPPEASPHSLAVAYGRALLPSSLRGPADGTSPKGSQKAQMVSVSEPDPLGLGQFATVRRSFRVEMTRRISNKNVQRRS